MRLCFTTIAFDWYQDLIPIYIYSILRSFPQHYVKIFAKDKLTGTINNCLDIIRKESDAFEVVSEFDDLDDYRLPLTANRFVLTREYFQEFDYIYIGDIDFIIFNQFEDNFYDTYLAHCQTTGLPFSNSWQTFDNQRMTGLHFIVKNRYFDAMDEQINIMKNPAHPFRQKQASYSFDEEMLYFMLSQKFDVDRLLDGYYRPLHGVHLGVFRHTLRQCIEYNDPHLTNLLPHTSKIDSIVRTDTFAKLYDALEHPKSKNMIKNALTLLHTKIFT